MYILYFKAVFLMSGLIDFLSLIEQTKNYVRKKYSMDTLIYYSDEKNKSKSFNKKLNKNLEQDNATIIKDKNEKQEKINELIEKYKNCSDCKLCKTRNNIVFGEGNPASELVIIGEAPGSNEDLNGIPFCGRAGDLLTKMLLAINIDRNNIYITNIVKCRPPQNRNPESDEIDACSKILNEQLEIIKPKYILTLGNFSAKFILNEPTLGVTTLRNKFYNAYNALVLPTFHPAYLLRFKKYKKDTWEDLQLLRDKMCV